MAQPLLCEPAWGVLRLRELLEDQFPAHYTGPEGPFGHDPCTILRGFRQEVDSGSLDDLKDPTYDDDLRTRQIPSQF